jgi:two-component system, cell cycle sensor histidine kinase and response regulator CckA
MSEATFSTPRWNILLIEDNPDDVALTLRALDEAGIEARAEVVQTAHEFCASLASREFDVVLADHRLPAWNGMEAVELLRQMEKDVPVILLTGALPDDEAAAFLQSGGSDYVLKDRLARLPAAMRRAIAIKSLSSFAELNPQPVLEFSRDGKLAFANAAAADLARALGKEHPSAMTPPDMLSIVQSCLSSRQKKLNVEATCGGHSLRWSFFPTAHNQSVHAYVSDLTEERKLEAQLRHAQRLEVAGRLATGIAHDFGNLLTVIQGHAGLLRAEANLSAAMQESIQQIVRAAERGGKLSNQLLAFSRQTTLRPRAIDLNEVLAGISSLLQRTIGEDIGINFDFGANLPLVYADAHAMEQCVLSIAINAREAMAGGGQLLINTSIADINAVHADHQREARQGRFVCLTVVDSGAGEPSVNRALDPLRMTKPGGSGFEFTLEAIKAIVQQHHGWIEVQSRMGEGTTLRIYLPLHVRSGPATAPLSRAARSSLETVLVVEDEAPVRSIVRIMLERSGFQVLEAGSGIEALAIWHQHQADIGLLVTDLVMPGGLSGPELAEKFRAQKPSLRILYTSGYSPRAAGNGVLPESGTDFLEKPFDAAQLAEAVQRSLEGAS